MLGAPWFALAAPWFASDLQCESLTLGAIPNAKPQHHCTCVMVELRLRPKGMQRSRGGVYGSLIAIAMGGLIKVSEW